MSLTLKVSKPIQLVAGLVMAAVVIGALSWLSTPGETYRAWLTDTALFSNENPNVEPRAVSLPHRWSASCSGCQTGWFELNASNIPPSREGYGLLIPRLSMTATLLINGRAVDGLPPEERIEQQHRYRPVYFSFSASHLAMGDDRVHLAISGAQHPQAWLSEMYLGPAGVMRKLRRQQESLSILPAQVAVVLSATLSLLFLMIWLRDRSAFSYLAFTGCSGFGAAYLLGFAVSQPPFSEPLWSFFLLANLLAAITFMPKALNLGSTASFRRGCYAAGAVGFGLLTLVWLAGTLPIHKSAFSIAIQLTFCLVLAWGTGSDVLQLLPVWMRTAVTAFCAVAMAQLAFYDLTGLRYGPLLIPMAAASALLLIAWALITQFINEFRASEVLNVKLNAAVIENTEEIRAQFEQIADYERSLTLSQERNRIMRDMHDGVGGQLVSALSMVESGSASPKQITESLREALSDMRLMIDSLDPTIDDVGSVLGILRERMQPQLASAGIALDWRVGNFNPSPPLAPHAALHLMRILQEAITNVLKHSGATHLLLAADEDEAGFGIEIVDNGSGANGDAPGLSHRGIANMHHRARELGGTLSIQNLDKDGASGTQIRLRLPYRTASDTAVPGTEPAIP